MKMYLVWWVHWDGWCSEDYLVEICSSQEKAKETVSRMMESLPADAVDRGDEIFSIEEVMLDAICYDPIVNKNVSGKIIFSTEES